MKPASTDLATLLGSVNAFFLADLVTLTLSDSSVYRWTGATQSLTFGGVTWSSLGPAIDAGRHRQEGDLTVDTRDVTLTCGDSVLVSGVPLQAQAAGTLFRRARILIGRAYMSTPGTIVGILPEFEGRVSDVQPSSTAVVLRCASELEVLKRNLPRFTWSPQCPHILADSNCGVNLATYTFTGTVTSSPTPTVARFNTSLLAPPSDNATRNWGFGRGYYGGGILRFTSGAISGLERVVEASGLYDSNGYVVQTGQLRFSYPWPSPPSVGDAFSLSLGCDKSYYHCRDKFGDNTVHFRGFTAIPRTSGR